VPGGARGGVKNGSSRSSSWNPLICAPCIAGRVDGVEHAYLHGTVCMHGRRQAGTSRERMRIVLARTYSSCEACEDSAERTRMACAIQRVARRMVA
jgi:hypothetical protein